MKNIILNNQQIEHIINRIAYQILENFNTENEIVIAGISKNGYILAEKIKEKFGEISSIPTILCEVFIEKQNPLRPISSSLKPENFSGKSIVLVDDVLNTGSTLIYGVKYFLEVPLKKFKTVVLVDRNHKKFPIKADFKGISLSTNISDTVKIEFVENSNIAYLV